MNKAKKTVELLEKGVITVEEAISIHQRIGKRKKIINNDLYND